MVEEQADPVAGLAAAICSATRTSATNRRWCAPTWTRGGSELGPPPPSINAIRTLRRSVWEDPRREVHNAV